MSHPNDRGTRRAALARANTRRARIMKSYQANSNAAWMEYRDYDPRDFHHVGRGERNSKSNRCERWAGIDPEPRRVAIARDLEVS